MLTLLILIPAAWQDVKEGRVENRLIAAGMASGIVLQILMKFPSGVLDFAAGAAVPVLTGWVLFRMRAVGAGDIKLFSVIGCVNGFQMMLDCLFWALCLAAVAAAVRLLHQRRMVSAFSDFFFICSQRGRHPADYTLYRSR